MADLQQAMGSVIRCERRKRRRTMKDLAQEAALSLVYLGEIERGKKYPSALILERLAQALGLAVPDLLEQVAMELRRATQPAITNAIGISMPAQQKPAGRIPIQGNLGTELRAAA